MAYFLGNNKMQGKEENSVEEKNGYRMGTKELDHTHIKYG